MSDSAPRAGRGSSRPVALQTISLVKEYRVGRGTVTALGGVDITILEREFVAIMGPSGCGKSTLLNLLGGLDQPTFGSVLVHGRDLSKQGEEQLAALRRETMGFIFQRHDLFPVLTAAENVEFPMLLDGAAPAERAARVAALLELVGLADKAAHLPDELSGGEQQRVGIARALANSARTLLADEPTGNLDSATAASVVDALVSLTRSRSLTLVVVTHDADVAARADRILHLKDGRLAHDSGDRT
jgi:ABC-type lipoprotein export system ATPase subunit